MSRRLAALGLVGLIVVPLGAILLVTSGGSDVGSATPASSASGMLAAPDSQAPGHEDAVARSDALAQRDPRRSRAILRRALARDPDDVRVLAALAERRLLDESPEARTLASRCLELSPGRPDCERVYRRGIDGEPRDDRTSKFLDDCLAADESRSACLASAVVERLRVSDVGGAVKASERLQATAPDDVLSVLSSARVLSAQGSYRAALAGFTEACERGQSYACFRAEALRADGW